MPHYALRLHGRSRSPRRPGPRAPRGAARPAVGRCRGGDRRLADRLLPVDRPRADELARDGTGADEVAAGVAAQVVDDEAAARRDVIAEGVRELPGRIVGEAAQLDVADPAIR